MKHIFVICFIIFMWNVFAHDSDFYIIKNSTAHDMKITTSFWKEVLRYALQVALPAYACVRIYDHYHYEKDDYIGHLSSETENLSSSSIIKWVFVPGSLSLVIDDESAYESFRALGLSNHEVTGEANSGIFGLFDSFRLHSNRIPNEPNHLSNCDAFIPEEALFVGGDGNTRLHDTIFDRNYEEANRLLKNGVEVNLKNKDGKTSLDIASQLGDEHMISILKDYGAEEASMSSRFVSSVNQ